MLRRSRTMWGISLILVVLLSLLSPGGDFAFGQGKTTGAISGTVFDPTGAVVTGAKVQLKDQLTGALREAVTNEVGAFLFPNLPFGIYEVTVTAPGFQTAVYSRIVVESARTTDVIIHLKVGEVVETVQIEGAVPALEITSNTVSNTVRNEAIQKLPLSGRNILNFALLVPGAQTVGGGGRFSAYNGMPGATINIMVDGINNNSQGFKSGGTSFFATVPPRLDAIEEVTISTAGLTADAGAEGAMQIRFVTRRGSNEFHGGIFHQLRNDALNANSYFNNARRLPRPRVRFNEFGGNLGGPLWRNRLFFFVNYEQARIPSQSTASNTILTPEAQQGIFRYRGTDGVERAVNLLQIAGASGYPSQLDPIVADYFRRTNETWRNGVITRQDLFRNTLSWLNRTNTIQHYPTARVDFHITPSLTWTGTWHLFNRVIDGTRPWPGPEFKEQSKFTNSWYIASTAVNWTISSRTLNEFKYGLQHNVDQYNVGEGPDQFYVDGRLMRIAYPFVPPLIRNQMNISRANGTHNLYNNLTLIRGAHSMTIGGSFRHVGWYDADFIGAGIPQYNVGIATGDPVTSVLNPSVLPGISSTDLTNAWNLYALLTGRVASISATRGVDYRTKQYRDLTMLVRLDRQRVGGFYFQDSWRYRPTLTLNYGFRWQFSGAIHDALGIYTSPTLEHLMGPSRQLFKPGVLDGVMDPQVFLRPRAYKGDFVNPGPNFGFAWSPRAESGFWQKLLGGEQKTVLRASYSLSYYDEGLLTFINYAGGNPGLMQSLFSNPGMPGFPIGQLRLSSPTPPLAMSPESFSPPFRQADYTFARGFSSMLPKLRTPYIQTWTIGLQREIARHTVIEARYVGNKGTHIWHGFDLNEVNIFENGFLQEFMNAQRNLAINQAAGVNSFANRGLPGQVPLPIFEAAFGARGSQPALSPTSGFSNGTFLNYLRQGQVGAFANALAGSSIYLCRMVGNLLPACARLGFDSPGPFPINFFQANPFAAGAAINLMTDYSYSSYHGLQVQVRRTYSQGLSFVVNYTFSKSLSDLFADSPTMFRNYTTLRNRGLDKGPSPFDLRHVFQAYGSWELPFGTGRRWATGNSVADKIIGGWTLSWILRWQSGRVFRLSSDRFTVNQRDSGVILNGLTVKELQKMLTVKPGPNATVFFVDPKLIGPDGRANPEILAPPTTPGVFGQFIYLYGPSLFLPDLSLSKEIPLTERVKFDLWVTALNAFNHPSFEVGSVAGSVSILSTTFGQTTATATGPREIQIRLKLSF